MTVTSFCSPMTFSRRRTSPTSALKSVAGPKSTGWADLSTTARLGSAVSASHTSLEVS